MISSQAPSLRIVVGIGGSVDEHGRFAVMSAVEALVPVRSVNQHSICYM